MKEAYSEFLSAVRDFIPEERIYTDELRRFAWGTDAGFYRLVPQIVIRSDNEREVSLLLAAASRLHIPVTFRAAGTSLSGQAISDSVLIVAGKHWEQYRIGKNAETITLQPGVIGGHVNEILAPLGREFGPDPASLASSMVGGIVINNASGMSCGTHAKSDKNLLSARIVFLDGTILDTGDPASRDSFRRSHPAFLRTSKPCAMKSRRTRRFRSASGASTPSRMSPGSTFFRSSASRILSRSSPICWSAQKEHSLS